MQFMKQRVNANHLRSLDEQGPVLQTTYRNELGLDIDFRRARGTVVIGHPDREHAGNAQMSQIVQTIRSYNSHLARIEVLTYGRSSYICRQSTHL